MNVSQLPIELAPQCSQVSLKKRSSFRPWLVSCFFLVIGCLPLLSQNAFSKKNVVSTFDISGTVLTEYGNLAPNVRIDISSANCSSVSAVINSTPATMCTDSSFSAQVCSDNDMYTITPVHTANNMLNGVTTFDLVIVQRHVLGVALLDSPYKMLAADFNLTGSITTADAVALRKAVLLQPLSNQFKPYRFVPADFVFTDPTNPFLDVIPSAITTGQIGSGNDFIAIKMGDMNGSSGCYIRKPAMLADPAILNAQIFQLPTHQWKMVFNVTSENALLAIQSAVKVTKGRIISYEAVPNNASFSNENMNAINDSTFLMAWASTLDPNDVLGQGEWIFSILLESGDRPEVEICRTSIAIEALTIDYEFLDVIMGIITDQGIMAPSQGLQTSVFPNPATFTDPVNLTIEGDSDGPVMVSVRSSNGTVVHRQKVFLKKGEVQTIAVNLSNQRDRVLYYVIEKPNMPAVSGTILVE